MFFGCSLVTENRQFAHVEVTPPAPGGPVQHFAIKVIFQLFRQEGQGVRANGLAQQW